MKTFSERASAGQNISPLCYRRIAKCWVRGIKTKRNRERIMIETWNSRLESSVFFFFHSLVGQQQIAHPLSNLFFQVWVMSRSPTQQPVAKASTPTLALLLCSLYVTPTRVFIHIHSDHRGTHFYQKASKEEEQETSLLWMLLKLPPMSLSSLLTRWESSIFLTGIPISLTAFDFWFFVFIL